MTTGTTPDARSRALRTILLAIVLALLVVPFGGPYTVPALLGIAGIVVFDLWRQSLPPRAPGRERTLPERLAIGALALIGVLVVLWAVGQLTG